MSTEPLPLVLDVDTGVDDACALLLAARHPGIDLRAVTCVAGNTDVDQVVANTLAVLHAAGRDDVPVARGADRPLVEPRREARHVHGEDGLADLGLPSPDRTAEPGHAVELLRDTLLAAAHDGRPVTLVPLAPLTTVALLLRTYPEVAEGLARILFMGGSAGVGNVTAAAEFNVAGDPEAAHVVVTTAVGLGIPVTMYGLDVFHGPRVTRAEAAALAALDDPGARLAGALVDFQCDRFGGEDAGIGDAGAVCAAVDPAGLGTRQLPVRVELSGSHSRGRTVVDTRGWAGDHAEDPQGPAPRIDVGLTVDGPRYAALWRRAVAGGL